MGTIYLNNFYAFSQFQTLKHWSVSKIYRNSAVIRKQLNMFFMFIQHEIINLTTFLELVFATKLS